MVQQIQFAEMEVSATIRWINAIADIEVGDEVIEETESRKIIARYTPLGVVGAIVPWNYPISITGVKLCGAMMTGNTIIIKPS